MPSTGIRTARVAIIPQHGTVKRGTLSSIMRQAGLAPDEFLKLLD
jgi:hypothetical protein